jgi:hypothetical protein
MHDWFMNAGSWLVGSGLAHVFVAQANLVVVGALGASVPVSWRWSTRMKLTETCHHVASWPGLRESHVMVGYCIREMCTVPDCASQQELVICYLYTHMVCHRPFPTLKQTLQNNSSLVEYSGPWGPLGLAGNARGYSERGFMRVFPHSWCWCTCCSTDTPCVADTCTDTMKVRATISPRRRC